VIFFRGHMFLLPSIYILVGAVVVVIVW